VRSIRWLALAPLAAAACSSPLPFRSRSESRAEELLATFESDPVRYEEEKADAMGDSEMSARFVAMAFDRAVELEKEAWKETFPEDPARKELTRQRLWKIKKELPEWGAPAARLCVLEISGYGLSYDVAVEVLGRIDPKTVEVPISDALASSSPEERRGAIRAAMAANAVKRMEGAIYPRIDDTSWIVRRETILALVNGTTPELNAALERRLADPQILVAREAALALGKRSVRASVDSLLRFLERAKETNDPLAIDAVITAFKQLSGRTDLGADLATWRQWVSQNRPIPTPGPATRPSESGTQSQPSAETPRVG
jgi:hypothetical protein